MRVHPDVRRIFTQLIVVSLGLFDRVEVPPSLRQRALLVITPNLLRRQREFRGLTR